MVDETCGKMSAYKESEINIFYKSLCKSKKWRQFQSKNKSCYQTIVKTLLVKF